MATPKNSKKVERKYPLRKMRKKIGVLFAGNYFLYDSTEISEGGITIEGEFVLTIGRDLIITLQVPGGESIVPIRSRVKTTNTDGALVRHGVEFRNLNFSVRREIRSFVSNWGLTEKNEGSEDGNGEF